MNTLIAETPKRAAKPRALAPKADALLKARLYLNAEAARQQAMSIWMAVTPKLRVEAAVDLFCSNEVSLERAAEIAGLNRWAFHALLIQRGIKIVVDTAPTTELEANVNALRKRR